MPYCVDGTGRIWTSASGGAWSTGATFDYYISTTGSDSNAGTLAAPWAITAINTKQATYAGKRVGIISGTYDVSSMMGTYHSPALNINGGSTVAQPTYIGSSDASGAYSARAATLDAKGSSGFYGGSNTNTSTVIGGATLGGTGGGPTPANWGNWILDGIVVTGFSIWALQVGSYDASGGLMPNVIIQNCEITGGNGANGPWSGTHSGPLEFYAFTNLLLDNCYLHDNTNSNADNTHYAAITVWGGNTGNSSGLTVQRCTLIHTGSMYGIYDFGVVSNTIIQQCYIDLTTPALISNANAVLGFGNSSATTGSIFRNNIFVGGPGPFDCSAGMTAQDFWPVTAQYYNNTWDLAAGAGQVGTNVGMRFIEVTGHTGIFKCYNNLFYDNGASLPGYGYNACNVDGFAVCDYNIYGTLNTFSTYGANGGTTSTAQTFATWKTAIGNLEANSSTNSSNPFTNSGARALQYLVQAGSPAYQTGRIGGVSTGGVVNVGAWDGIVSQIGSNF